MIAEALFLLIGIVLVVWLAAMVPLQGHVRSIFLALVLLGCIVLVVWYIDRGGI